MYRDSGVSYCSGSSRPVALHGEQRQLVEGANIGKSSGPTVEGPNGTEVPIEGANGLDVGHET